MVNARPRARSPEVPVHTDQTASTASTSKSIHNKTLGTPITDGMFPLTAHHVSAEKPLKTAFSLRLNAT